MSTPHTPLPWVAHGTTIAGGGVTRLVERTGGACVRFVAECDHNNTADDKKPSVEDLANATFIARACNNHAALLAACQSVLRSAGYESGQAEPSLRELRVSLAALSQVRAAIAKAKGGVT